MYRLLLAAMAGILLCLHWFDAGASDFGWAMVAIGTALALLPAFTLCGVRAFSPLAMAYAAFAILYGLGMLMWLALHEWEVGAAGEQFWTGSAAIVLGLIGFVMGYGTSTSTAPNARPPRVWREDRLFPALLALSLVGLSAAGALIIAAGGVSEYLSGYVEKQLEIFRGWGLYLTLLSPMLSIGTLLAYMFSVETGRGRLAFWLMLLAACAVNLLISRTQFFFLPAVLALASVLRRGVSPLWLASWVVLGVCAFFAFGVLRELTFSDKPLLEDADIFMLFVLIHFDMFDSLMLLLERADWSYQFGWTMIAPMLVKAIPRTVWEGKPPGTAQWFMDMYFPGWEEIGFSRAVGGVDEYFINFGLPGCFLMFVLWGFIGRKLFAWYLAHRDDSLCTVLYAYSVISLFFFFRNELQVWLPYYLAFVIPFLVVAALVRPQFVVRVRATVQM